MTQHASDIGWVVSPTQHFAPGILQINHNATNIGFFQHKSVSAIFISHVSGQPARVDVFENLTSYAGDYLLLCKLAVAGLETHATVQLRLCLLV